MLHKKHFEIIEQFLGDYNKEVYGRGLVPIVSLSQKGIALALDELEKEGILSSKKKGNMKFFKLNKNNSGLGDILIAAEITKKINFMAKHQKVANLFRSDYRLVGVFGSYAKGTQYETSYLDVFIIGKKAKDDYIKKGKFFDLEVSIKYFSENEFKKLLKQKNHLIKEIVENHISIFGVERFVQILWGDFIGNN